MVAEIVVKVVNQGGGWLTPVVAIVGLVLAVASLLWQWFSYRLGGPRLKVELKWGYMGAGGLVSARIDAENDALMFSQGMTQKLLGVKVQNVGRLSVSIDGAMARSDVGVSFAEIGFSQNPVPGFRLEPHSSETWWVRWERVTAMVSVSAATKAEWNRNQRVRMVVRPAAGEEITTKQYVDVVPT